jgi:hypothetical protein
MPASIPDCRYKTAIRARIAPAWRPANIASRLLAAPSLGLRIGKHASRFLAFGFLGQLTLEPLPFSGLQVESMFLYLFENTFLLDLSLETTHRALDRFALKNLNFSQKNASSEIRSPA